MEYLWTMMFANELILHMIIGGKLKHGNCVYQFKKSWIFYVLNKAKTKLD